MTVLLTVILSVLALVLLAFLVVMLFFTVHLRHLRKLQPNEEMIVGNGEKRALLVFQPSRHTFAKRAALSIADNLAANGYSVTINHPRPDLTYNWSDYALVALGSPTYMGQVSPLLKYYAQQHQVSGMHLVLWTTGLLRDETTQLRDMAAWSGLDNGYDAIKFHTRKEPDAKDFVEQSLRNWEESKGPYFTLHEQAEANQTGSDEPTAQN